MKFKLVFVAFNLIILFSFLFVFLLPFFFLGPQYTQVFWLENWYLAALFLVIIVVLNLYFAKNWRLFGLLESEDWHGLVEYLEREVFERKRLRRQHLRLLVNAYVVVSEPDKITRLEEFLRSRSPSLVAEFAVELGIPHLLSNDSDAITEYFGGLSRNSKTKNRDWVRWGHAFGLMLKESYEDAKSELLELLDQRKDPVLQVLTAYMLESYRRHDEQVARRVQEELNRLRNAWSAAKWQKQLERSRSNLLVLVMAKLLQDASSWAFPDWYPSEAGGAVGSPSGSPRSSQNSRNSRNGSA